VDDRLYDETEKADTEKSSLKDDGGKDQKPEIDAADLLADTPENEVKDPELSDSEDLTPSIKLGEFVRDTSNLARAHEFSRTNEPELGMS
jgi:type IV secretion system protein VirD4